MMSKPKVIFHRFKMSVPEGRGFRIIPYADILWLQASGHYTQMALHNDNTSRFIYEPLDELEHHLPSVFYRCHRSAIVNLCHVQSFSKCGIHVNGHVLPIAQKNKTKIRHLLEKNERLTFPLCGNCDICDKFIGCPMIYSFAAKKIS